MFGIDIPIWSALLGSLSGVVGHWFKTKEEKDRRSHEAVMLELTMKRDKLNSELAIAEIEANLKVTEVITEGNLLVSEAKDFNSVVASLNKNALAPSVLETLLEGGWGARFFGVWLAFMLGLVDILRGIVRPALTAGAFASVGYIAFMFAENLDGFTTVERLSLLMLLIDAMIYVLTAATQFWFMDRAGARSFRKKH